MNKVKLKDIFRFKNGKYYQVTEIDHVYRTIRLYRIVLSDFHKSLVVVNNTLNSRSVQGAIALQLDTMFGDSTVIDAFEALYDLREFIWMEIDSLRLNVHCRTLCTKGFIFDMTPESIQDLTIPDNAW